MLFFIRVQMVDCSSHLGSIWWRPRCRVQTARVWPLHPPCARGIAIFAALVLRNVSNSGPVWRDGDKCLSAQNCLNCLSWLCLPKWKSAVTSIGTYLSHLFLVSKTVARPTLSLLSLILHKVWASPWNTWGDFWNKCVIPSLVHVRKHASDVYLHERILAWMKAYELRIARVKNCRKMFAYFSLDDLFFCTCCDGTFGLLPKTVLLVFDCSSLFTFLWNLKNWWLMIRLCFESAASLRLN